jgi:hypothetical protein
VRSSHLHHVTNFKATLDRIRSVSTFTYAATLTWPPTIHANSIPFCNRPTDIPPKRRSTVLESPLAQAICWKVKRLHPPALPQPTCYNEHTQHDSHAMTIHRSQPARYSCAKTTVRKGATKKGKPLPLAILLSVLEVAECSACARCGHAGSCS